MGLITPYAVILVVTLLTVLCKNAFSNLERDRF